MAKLKTPQKTAAKVAAKPGKSTKSAPISYEVKVTKFKDKPMFEIHDANAANPDYSIIISFGLRKATAILANIEALTDFVAEHVDH